MRWLVLLGVLGLVCCSPSSDVVRIRQYHLRSLEAAELQNAPLRAEALRRFHGAVSEEEQRERLGHYYTVYWDGPEGREGDPIRILFEYRQAATGADISLMSADLPGEARGKVEFQVTGPAYLRAGRVLAWRLRFFRAGELIETHRSYMWE